MKPFTAVIADDEALARERIRTLLEPFSRVQVAAEAGNGKDALAAINEHRPALLFLDVQMPEMDGFAVLQELDPNDLPCVVFVTAYDEFALRAFEVHAVDYLLKPFTRQRFERAMEHALQVLDQSRLSQVTPRLLSLLQSVAAEGPLRDRIAIRAEQGIYFLRVSNIDWVEASRNYLRLHAGGQQHVLRETLKKFQERLDPARFLRVHRSVIINIDFIQRLEPWFHGEYMVVLRDGTQLTSSRNYSEQLRALLR